MTMHSPQPADEPDLVTWAADVAEEHLAPLGRRWRHVQRVAARAAQIAVLVEDDRDTLIAASYLHDIGYAPALVQTGFHPVDGARFVRQQGHEPLARLVAHHTGARTEARLRRLTRELEEFPFEDSELDRLLTFCDLTTGPDGSRVTVADRVAEICHRYGDAPPARSAALCLPEFLRLEQATEERLVAAAFKGQHRDGTRTRPPSTARDRGTC